MIIIKVILAVVILIILIPLWLAVIAYGITLLVACFRVMIDEIKKGGEHENNN